MLREDGGYSRTIVGNFPTVARAQFRVGSTEADRLADVRKRERYYADVSQDIMQMVLKYFRFNRL